MMLREVGERLYICDGASRSASIMLQTTLLLPLLVAVLLALAKH